MMTLPEQIAMERVRTDIRLERERQDAKWGQQNHTPMEWLAVLGEEVGEACQGALRARFGGRSLDEYRTEMVHVAAVAIAALESLDRQPDVAGYKGSENSANPRCPTDAGKNAPGASGGQGDGYGAVGEGGR